MLCPLKKCFFTICMWVPQRKHFKITLWNMLKRSGPNRPIITMHSPSILEATTDFFWVVIKKQEWEQLEWSPLKTSVMKLIERDLSRSTVSLMNIPYLKSSESMEKQTQLVPTTSLLTSIMSKTFVGMWIIYCMIMDFLSSNFQLSFCPFGS